LAKITLLDEFNDWVASSSVVNALGETSLSKLTSEYWSDAFADNVYTSAAEKKFNNDMLLSKKGVYGGMVSFPVDIINSSDISGLYKSYLKFTAIETTRVELQAAGASKLYGHNGTTSTANVDQRCDIILPVPGDLSTTYSHSYGEGHVSALEMAAAEAIAGGSFATGMGDATIGSIKRMLVSALSAENKVAKLVGANVTQNLTNKTKNDKTSLEFSKTNLRTFTADWNFFPKSQKELQELQKVIEMFKLFSHPEGTLGDEFIKIPCKWIIEEIPIQAPNKVFKPFKFGPAAITNISIKKETDNQFQTGDVLEYNVTIQFTETFSLFKSDMGDF
jgi:hypothetical protein